MPAAACPPTAGSRPAAALRRSEFPPNRGTASGPRDARRWPFDRIPPPRPDRPWQRPRGRGSARRCCAADPALRLSARPLTPRPLFPSSPTGSPIAAGLGHRQDFASPRTAGSRPPPGGTRTRVLGDFPPLASAISGRHPRRRSGMRTRPNSKMAGSSALSPARRRRIRPGRFVPLPGTDLTRQIPDWPPATRIRPRPGKNATDDPSRLAFARSFSQPRAMGRTAVGFCRTRSMAASFAAGDSAAYWARIR